MELREIESDQKNYFVPMEIDLTDEEATILAKIGLERITLDPSALIDYAVKSLLEDHIKVSVEAEEQGELEEDGTENNS